MPVTASGKPPDEYWHQSGGSTASCQEKEVTAVHGRSILLLSQVMDARRTLL
jgi:hypothetical protein